MKRYTIQIGLVLLTIISIISQAQAAPMYAYSKVFFDSSGHVIGQHVLFCNAIQHNGGITNSPYYRVDEYLCGTQVLSGLRCDDVPEIIDGNFTGRSSYICNYTVVTAPPGSVIANANLPDGFTIEDSCAVASCESYPEPSILPGF